MGFFGLQKPFKKDSVNDYQGVLVPLSQAARHPTVAAEYARKKSAEGARNSTEHVGKNDESEGKDVGTGRAEEGVIRTTGDAYSPYTIEGLKAEVFKDITASGHDSTYDCKPPLVSTYFS